VHAANEQCCATSSTTSTTQLTITTCTVSSHQLLREVCTTRGRGISHTDSWLTYMSLDFAAGQVCAHVGQQLAKSLRPQLQQTVNRCDTKLEQLGHGFGPQSTKTRALRNAALGLLSYDWTEEHQQQVLDRCGGGV
jgi:hypothetical protein